MLQSVCCDLFKGSLIKFGAFAFIPIETHFFGENYYVVIDGEAGIEQINRRVMENITYLILGIVILFIIRKRQEVRQ